ncbi:MAG: ferrous iron transport protein B [Alphaproteobacteria bacterium]|nr:ferrous iron transport protein B [Alphaproteobacteria bacterium]
MALVGAPNCGKSTLFNGLTGGRAKVANYPGATVEMRYGDAALPSGRKARLVDLPGVYGLTPRSRDERVTVDLLTGAAGSAGPRPDLILALIDASTLRTHLHSILQIRRLGAPMILVLNMMDLANRDGLEIDLDVLASRLGLPVVAGWATRRAGREGVLKALDAALDQPPAPPPADDLDLKALQQEGRAIARAATIREPTANLLTRRIDAVVLHPVIGPAFLATLLFFVFQAVFSWSAAPMEALENGFAAIGGVVRATLPESWVRDLIVDGVVAGVGSVVVFLPQILILFAFILALEASGYMARAAFLMDELMSRVGLNGRAFIPLLSSFACAIPGIMSARVIDSERDRITTIMIAPLMTCSARLPVYAVLIAAFIPPTLVGPFNLQGLVLFGLYGVGVVSGVTVAFVLKRTVAKGAAQPLIMELPTYKPPDLRDFLIGLWTRASAFLKRAGTIILGTSIVLWFLAAYPSGATNLRDTFAGRLGAVLEPVFAPIGFNLEIAIALIPGMAAREVAVGALGTIYAVQNPEENAGRLAETLQGAWSLPTALAFLAWFVFAPQCFATLATIRRETNSWAWTGFAFAYLMGLAYLMSGVTYWTARAIIG